MKQIKKALVSGGSKEFHAKLKQLFIKAGYEISAALENRQAAVENQDVIISAQPGSMGFAIKTSYGKQTAKTAAIPVFAVIPKDDYNPALLFDAPRWGVADAAETKPANVRLVMEETEKILNRGLEGYFVMFAGYHCVAAATAAPALKKTA